MQTHELAVSMKLGMRRLASGVCVLATRLPSGERFAMTVSSVTSLSDAPASLLVCINRSVSQQDHLSQPGVAFSVNVLSVAHKEVSNACAGKLSGEERFDIGSWSNAEGKPLYLKDALASFDCVIDEVVAYGTHNIVIAHIVNVRVSDDAVEPLLYVDGSYGELARI
jgi:flavin reductase (DIM6/NTAB) family NADH-FMN oxidoreductase RutF